MTPADCGENHKKSSDQRVVMLEVPEAWFDDPSDGNLHQRLYASILSALAELDVVIRPVWLPRGADLAPRDTRGYDLVLSYHSYGTADSRLLRCKESYIPPYYTMDDMGYACFSRLSCHPDEFSSEIARQDPAVAATYVRQLAERLRRENCSKYSQPPFGENTLQGYVFVPLQVQSDPVSQKVPLQISRALEAIVSAASARGLRTIIKRHPRCKSATMTKLLQQLEKKPDVDISTASVHALMANAECVVGANSGVLFEALIQGKPVISYGASEFARITQAVTSYEDLFDAVSAPQPIDSEHREKFIYWYLEKHCIKAGDVLGIKTKIEKSLKHSSSRNAYNQTGNTIYKLQLQFHSLKSKIKRRIF